MRERRPKFQKERPPDPDAPDTPWRLFLAVPVPPPVVEAVGIINAELAREEWPVRWVGEDTAHLTLHFLGETEPEQGELLRIGLPAVIGGRAPFRLRTTGIGVFPDFNAPNVIWLGLDGETSPLEELWADLGDALDDLGFPIEERPFHPHITLGRVREGAPGGLGGQVKRRLQDPALAALVERQAQEFAVTEVVLVRSYLERGGPRHVAIGRYRLGG